MPIKTHTCYCGKVYDCPWCGTPEAYLCPTINGDENAHLCPECEHEQSEEYLKFYYKDSSYEG